MAGPESARQERLVFVVGSSRSGTTMMGRILGKHPAVFTFGELHFFEQLWSSADKERRISETEAARLVARLMLVQRQGYLSRGDAKRFCEEARGSMATGQSRTYTSAEAFKNFLFYEAAKNGKTIPCDQTPRNVFYIGEILELFPEARVINMIRDPRDVLLSQKRKWKRRFLGARGIPLREALRSWVNYHPITVSKLWNASARAASRFADERVYSLRFEDLLADPEGAVREVCRFIDIPFNGSLLEVPQVGSSSGWDRPERKGIDKGRAGSWRKGGVSPTEVFLCERVAGPVMKRYGYPLTQVTPNPLRLGWSLASLPAKLLFALLLNLRRMRSIKETIKRRLL